MEVGMSMRSRIEKLKNKRITVGLYDAGGLLFISVYPLDGNHGNIIKNVDEDSFELNDGMIYSISHVHRIHPE
jgi:hypothetical protein